jgi:hypothetical protein
MTHGFTTTSSGRIGLMSSKNNTYHSMRLSSVRLLPIRSGGINNGFWRKMATTMMRQMIPMVPKKAVAKYLRQSGLSGKAKPNESGCQTCPPKAHIGLNEVRPHDHSDFASAPISEDSQRRVGSAGSQRRRRILFLRLLQRMLGDKIQDRERKNRGCTLNLESERDRHRRCRVSNARSAVEVCARQ